MKKGWDEKKEWKRKDRLILWICFNVSFGVKCLKRQSFWVKTNIVWVRGSSEFTGIVSIIKTRQCYRLFCVYNTKKLHSRHSRMNASCYLFYVCIWIFSVAKKLLSFIFHCQTYCYFSFLKQKSVLYFVTFFTVHV